MRRTVILCIACAAATAGAQDAPGSPVEHYLYVAYFCPVDRDPAADCQERIDRIVTDIQAFYRDQMAANGYGEMAFPLQRDDKGKLVIHMARGDRDLAYYGPDKGQEVRDCVKQVLAEQGVDAERETVLIFQPLIETDGDKLTSNCPYYGGGDYRSGTAWVTDHELLDTLNLPKKEPFIVDREIRYSVGKFCSVQLGGVAHELGHAFGLPHNRARREEAEAYGTALMGSGNYTYREELRGEGKGSFLTRASAMILSSHPLFGRSDAESRTEVDCDLAQLQCALEHGDMVLTGRVRSSLPVYGVNAYSDPEGGSDYDALAWSATVGDSGRFRVVPNQFEPGRHELRLRFLHTNGAERTFRYPFRVAENGTPDCQAINLAYRLDRALVTLDGGHADAAAHAADGVVAAARAIPEPERTADQDELARKAAYLKRLAEGEAAQALSPDRVPDGRKTIYLSELEWESAEVGWFQPARDRIPEGESERFLESGARFHEHGLYAHAPSRYVFALDGRWKTLAGTYGLQRGHDGSVVFVVRADGKEVLRSEVIRDFDEHPFELDVRGARALELIVDPTDDGNASDWGIWFSPQLGR